MFKKFFSFMLLFVFLSLSVFYLKSENKKKEITPSVRTNSKGSFVSLSEGFTHYELLGKDGDLVLLVHGATVPMWDFDFQVNALTSQGFRVLRYDQYGRGLSDRPQVRYDFEVYKKQLLELVDALEINEPFHIVGHSFGGALAAGFAAEYPKRINKIVLFAPVLHLIKNSKGIEALKIPFIGKPLIKIVVPMTMKRMQRVYTNASERKHYSSLYKKQLSYKGFERALFSMFTSDALLNHHPSYKALASLSKDILVVWGDKDKDISEEAIEEVRNLIGKHEFERFEGGGHSLNVSYRKEFNKRLVHFLKQ